MQMPAPTAGTDDATQIRLLQASHIRAPPVHAPSPEAVPWPCESPIAATGRSRTSHYLPPKLGNPLAADAAHSLDRACPASQRLVRVDGPTTYPSVVSNAFILRSMLIHDMLSCCVPSANLCCRLKLRLEGGVRPSSSIFSRMLSRSPQQTKAHSCRGPEQ